MFTSLFIIFSLFVSSSFSYSSPCNQLNQWNSSAFDELYSTVELFKTFEEKRNYLYKSAKDSAAQGFNSSQIVGLLSLFNETSSIDIASGLSRYNLGMETLDVVTILEQSGRGDHQLALLGVLSNLTLDMDEGLILEVFKWNNFYYELAEYILSIARPLSCVWGDVSTYSNVVLMADKSALMGNFIPGQASIDNFSNGELSKAINALRSDQKFNVIYFNDYVYNMWDVSQNATADNVGYAYNNFLGSIQYPFGKRVIFEALQYVLNDTTVDAIVLVTADGPDASMRYPVLKWVEKWVAEDPSRTFNAVSIQSGQPINQVNADYWIDVAVSGLGIARVLG